MKRRNYLLFLSMIAMFVTRVAAEDGSRLWLRQTAGDSIVHISIPRQSPTLNIAAEELRKGWKGVPVELHIDKKQEKTKSAEGFCIRSGKDKIIITSRSEIGLLYGSYHLLRLQATHTLPSSESAQPIYEVPASKLRILNHWDNLDGTVERGYAGQSLWKWDELPDKLSPRYTEYARANASIGINGTVLNNVNASPQILSEEYLQKIKTLADIFRPYGIRVFLSINFATPIVLGGLPTADPLDKDVIHWWKQKIKQIYHLIPDFGGFLVKANSEGQPGPCDYGRTHAQGANMLADALKPYKGIVMWRAFVYSPTDADRAKQAYLEFQPLNGQFHSNVIVQIKNGPVDFQPREPYSPLFGAMPQTQQMVEFQITQEYLGFSNHIAFLAPMWKEFYNFVSPTTLKAVAGVSNIGTDTNWCGHHFAQANWYAFGRLAWNPHLSSEKIADEWLKQTLYINVENTKDEVHTSLKQLMLESREAIVNYMMPLGLHHLFAWGHHYGPQPWCNIAGTRPDWMPSYYHKADEQGIGFNRSSTGSNAVMQYPDSLRQLYNNIYTCPEEYLLWFHHVPWTHTLSNGFTLWEELCKHYDHGVQQVREFQKIWNSAQNYIDSTRFVEIQSKLKIQMRDAIWWKDACLLYFQQFSKKSFPYSIEQPIHELNELQKAILPISNFECPDSKLLNAIR